MAGCSFCGQPMDPMAKIGFRETCPKCHRDLHTCKNCRFHDPSAHNQCREPQSETVSDRERANFCTWFSPGSSFQKSSKEADVIKKKLEDLFRKK